VGEYREKVVDDLSRLQMKLDNGEAHEPQLIVPFVGRSRTVSGTTLDRASAKMQLLPIEEAASSLNTDPSMDDADEE